MNRVKIDTLHLVEMRLEIQRLVEAESYGTEKTGQIFFLVGPLLSKLKCGMETVVLRGRGLLWAQFGTV